MADESSEPVTQMVALSRVPLLRDRAVEALRELLLSGGLKQGDRINEVELAAQLRISRGPLREAIQRLRAEGIVESRQNQGAYVRVISPEDLAQLFDFRELIERKAAALVAVRGSASDLARLRDYIEAARKSLRAGEPYPRSAGDLHKLILEMCGNPYLQLAGQNIQNQVRLARIQARRGPQWAAGVYEQHEIIIAAIEQRDPERASLAMADHLRSSLKHLSDTENG
ncbi:GntR family transcriptional regulator [Streptomyces sp. NPDC001982]|uniref:GntR family transcriptional regulator n=1 Tax=Streptomyces sp. NPDC001982 TaxID=3154405 RepID=UPI0033232BA4